MNGFAIYRRRCGLTQSQVAKILKIDHSTVAKWDTGKSLPRGGMLKRTAQLYGCSVDQLLSDGETVAADCRRYDDVEVLHG